ncbi:MAG: HAMP domain-containing histidine kinase [Ruminococcus sp.]|nr:HAMP domain-containing histidine kinase [Ruminococcus sp.]
MKLSLQFKVTLMFFAVMLISALISTAVLLLVFNNTLRDNSEEQVKAVISSANTLQNMAANYEKEQSAEKIVAALVGGQYEIKEISRYSDVVREHHDDIESQSGYVIVSGFIPSASGYIKIYDTYYEISTDTSDNTYWMASFIVLIAFIVCIVLGTLFTAVISRMLLKPIRELSNATSEVARGNFSVRVRESGSPEYAVLMRNFNKMANDLSGIETLRGDFISNVSHEFKTPLASIQGFAKLLQDSSLSQHDRDEYAQVIIDETTRLTKLTSNILNLSKLENQTTISKKTRFSLDEQIRNIILMLEPEWSKKNIDLDIALDDVYYYGNEDLMGQIWQNIINNAIKFTPYGGKIMVQLYQTENNITAKITDNGIGISEEAKEKIFEKFYQGDHSRKTEGNGLGLALVKRIIDLCEGDVYVDNVLGGGVCFTVILPFVIGDMM